MGRDGNARDPRGGTGAKDDEATRSIAEPAALAGQFLRDSRDQPGALWTMFEAWAGDRGLSPDVTRKVKTEALRIRVFNATRASMLRGRFR